MSRFVSGWLFQTFSHCILGTGEGIESWGFLGCTSWCDQDMRGFGSVVGVFCVASTNLCALFLILIKCPCTFSSFILLSPRGQH